MGFTMLGFFYTAHQKVGADEATDEPTAQQEGAGKNPARFAVDALQGGRAKNAFLAVADGGTAKTGFIGVSPPFFCVPQGVKRENWSLNVKLTSFAFLRRPG